MGAIYHIPGGLVEQIDNLNTKSGGDALQCLECGITINRPAQTFLGYPHPCRKVCNRYPFGLANVFYSQIHAYDIIRYGAKIAKKKCTKNYKNQKK